MKFKSILCFLLTVALITVSFGGCGDKKVADKNSSPKVSVTDKKTKSKDEQTEENVSYKEITVIFASYKPGNLLLNDAEPQVGENLITRPLKSLIEQYKDKDVYLAAEGYFEGMYSADSDEPTYASVEEYTKLTVKLGGYVYTHKNSSTFGIYAPPEAILEIAKLGGWRAMPAPPQRNTDHNGRISNSLSHLLGKMEENEEIEVMVVTAADQMNYFADHDLNLGVGPDLNREFYLKSDYEKIVSSKASYDKYLQDIISQNNISKDKVLKTSDGFRANQPQLSCGFTALLTKEQILKLSADSRIKLMGPNFSIFESTAMVPDK